jgi:hypothetical protein
MRELDIDLRRIRTLMGFQRKGPLSRVYIMRGEAVGGEPSYATNPSCSRPYSPRNPSQARGASTPVTGVPAPYMWTLRSSEPRYASSSPMHDYIGTSYPNSTSVALRV